MASERPVPRFFLLLVAATTVLLGMVLAPIISELLLAAVLAAVLFPLQGWITRKLHVKSGVAAGLLTAAVVVLLLGPLAALLTVVVRDGADGLRFVSETLHGPKLQELLGRLPANVRDVVIEGVDRLPKNVEEAVGQVGANGGQAAAAVTSAVATTSSAVFHTTMMVIALFFFLAHGKQAVHWVDEASPLPHGQTLELLGAFKRVSYAVIVSTLVTSAVQALAALVGYLIARVPSPLFFTCVTFFVAFIPAVGAAAVCLVAAGLLLVTGHTYMAIFLAAWGLVVVGLVDNVIKPLLIKSGMEIHGGVVFFSLIGGLAAFGAIGLLVGPLVVAMFLALLRMYHRDFSPEDSKLPAVPGLPRPPGAVPPT
jgi:predicted PurR-regulated permease PerM